MTVPSTPKKKVVGRNEPDSPELAGAHLIVSVGLKKHWSKKPSYWVDIYGKHEARPSGHPPPPAMKIIRFYVFRQWAFLKGSVFDTDRELVEGGFLIPTCYTQVKQALDGVLEIASKQVIEKGYEVCDIDVPAEVQGQPWGLMLLSDIESYKSLLLDLNSQRSNKGPSKPAQIAFDHLDEGGAKKAANKPSKEDFWDTARKREKNSKW